MTWRERERERERERDREREREREVYLQLDELDSNTYNTYNINIIQYNTYNIVGIQVLLIMLTANCSIPIAICSIFGQWILVFTSHIIMYTPLFR